MGRNKQETTVVPADNTLEVLPALTEAANTLAARSSEIAKQFGDGLPYERHRVVNEARFYMAQSAEAMLEAGKRLILLKENEPHGEFTTIVEEQLGLAPRTARLMIQAAVKYSSPQLESKRQALAVLGKTKLFELMTEDDEELAALADGGTIAGMDLDDIDRMTSRELRAALREAHENATAQARLLSDKNAKIDELAAKKTRVKRVTPDEEGAEIRKETSAIAFEAESVIRGNLRAAFETLAQHAETHGAPHDDFMAGVLGQIQLSLNQLRSEFGVKAAADGDDVPQWLRDTSTGSADADFSRAAN
ncbi:DUF3102 domain-containing protein [Burkholderia cenocepacia]|uniref:DUF3102 domain-containing protein n=1 Tax=Burkholderia cenocepacia TaxID=95486 RepID=A0ABD4UPF6_9BURK|nr:DUF3102 domain-containing protein [Burkholderia cenocepacia]MCW3700394.1 DUF3102 domain-containing protein [Burkholderia cenocepacia]MCW3707813.1 DUF3102 domain-containing protein [Burkholderia cenocepacia]MCW3716320.1 DUF3102 domain-containing protein [Burkholderia cenocepacia]MCW3724609.1 DUF3102 domain-containing protein [Burkholderia cenocepacia]MCW3731661.1 DUF3102 domain-containing protein [Burkholderia cenocepacia]